MSSTISNFPKGLTGLLGIQSFGETPRQLSDVVSGVLDLRDLYLLNFMQCGIGTDAAPALGSRNFSASTLGYIDLSLPVPANEVWFVHEYHVSVAPGAATGITVQPRVRASNASLGFAPPLTVTGIAGAPSVLVPSYFPRMWLPPGSLFGYLVNAITGAPGSVDGVAWISRFVG